MVVEWLSKFLKWLSKMKGIVIPGVSVCVFDLDLVCVRTNHASQQTMVCPVCVANAIAASGPFVSSALLAAVAAMKIGARPDPGPPRGSASKEEKMTTERKKHPKLTDDQ